MNKTTGIRKIETLLDKGDSKYLENGVCIKEDGHSAILAICDSFSKPYDSSKNPIILFGGLSSGEIVKNIYFRTIEKSHIKNSLLSIAREANKEISDFQKKAGFPMRSDGLAGLVFAMIKINKDKIEILQGGDCIVVWKNKNDSIAFTPNTVLTASKYLKKSFSNLLSKHKGNRERTREEFTPILMKEKMQNINQKHKEAYPVMNGKLNLELCYHKIFNTKDISEILLLADGLIPFQWFENKTKMKKLINEVKQHGLNFQLKQTRKEQKTGKTTKDITAFPESAAVFVSFSD